MIVDYCSMTIEVEKATNKQFQVIMMAVKADTVLNSLALLYSKFSIEAFTKFNKHSI